MNKYEILYIILILFFVISTTFLTIQSKEKNELEIKNYIPKDVNTLLYLNGDIFYDDNVRKILRKDYIPQKYESIQSHIHNKSYNIEKAIIFSNIKDININIKEEYTGFILKGNLNTNQKMNVLKEVNYSTRPVISNYKKKNIYKVTNNKNESLYISSLGKNSVVGSFKINVVKDVIDIYKNKQKTTLYQKEKNEIKNKTGKLMKDYKDINKSIKLGIVSYPDFPLGVDFINVKYKKSTVYSTIKTDNEKVIGYLEEIISRYDKLSIYDRNNNELKIRYYFN